MPWLYQDSDYMRKGQQILGGTVCYWPIMARIKLSGILHFSTFLPLPAKKIQQNLERLQIPLGCDACANCLTGAGTFPILYPIII